MPDPLYSSELHSLPLLARGKVRDIYEVGPSHLLIVTTDRLSAFDVVLPTPIPDKGIVLNQLSNFWFGRLNGIVTNHLSTLKLEDVLTNPKERQQVAGRAVVVNRYRPLPIEAIVRGYLAGSGWKEYRSSGTVCGITLPTGLREADRLPQPIFTPSTKAAADAHDENISFDRTCELVGRETAEQVRRLSLALYMEAATFAQQKGIIIADTKFEFGADDAGNLVLIDEALTPDSSRFWPADAWRPGSNPPSFDKQYVRDWLEASGWDKTPPAPALPAEIATQTAAKYREALVRLTGNDIEPR